MKRTQINRALLLFLLLFAGISFGAVAQDEEKAEEEKPELNLNLRYFLQNNKIPYLTVETNTKVKRKFEPVTGTKVQVYLDEVTPENLLGNVVTDEKGKASLTIPPAKKALWNAANMHTFIGVAAPLKKFEETTTELEITKSRLAIKTDTAGGTKNVMVVLEELKEDNTWAVVPEIELKVGVQRLNSVLPVGTDESYTTDSTGIATAEFTREGLPGDDKGNLTLVASVVDNDMYGNLTLEKTVPWGIVVHHPNTFNDRTLFATRDKAPYWLLFLSGLIFFTVWGTIVYLAILLYKIWKLGKKEPVEKTEPVTPLTEAEKPQPIELAPVVE